MGLCLFEGFLLVVHLKGAGAGGDEGVSADAGVEEDPKIFLLALTSVTWSDENWSGQVVTGVGSEEYNVQRICTNSTPKMIYFLRSFWHLLRFSSIWAL